MRAVIKCRRERRTASTHASIGRLLERFWKCLHRDWRAELLKDFSEDLRVVIAKRAIWMDPRIAWFAPEQLGPSHDLWTRLWETARKAGAVDMNLQNNNSPCSPAPDYISLDLSDDDPKQAAARRNNAQNMKYQRRKRDNRASTYGLNHSSAAHHLRDSSLTPWKRPGRRYSSPAVIGSVGSYFWP